MPTRKLINDYTFYKIVNINRDIELCYVGSTVNMKERVRTHRNVCNNKNNKRFNNKLYTTIREHGGWCEFKMIEIGTAEQLTLTQARIIEEEFRVKLNAKLNSHKCFSTPEQTKQQDYEYREKNKEKIAVEQKEYREKNKEQIAEKRKEKIICECGCIVRTNNLPKHKRTQKHIDLIEKLVTKNKLK